MTLLPNRRAHCPTRTPIDWFVPPNEPTTSYEALREQEAIFDHVETIGGVEDTATLAGENGEPAEQLDSQRFSAAVSQALGATPLMGRWFTEGEAARGSPPVIVISHQLWQNPNEESTERRAARTGSSRLLRTALPEQLSRARSH
jgi:hypothetical protein